MNHRVIDKQANARMCLVCGLANAAGLQASFYDLDDGRTVGLFTARDEHQGYPGRLHGGIITAMLDEAVGRALMAAVGGGLWGVTAEFTTRFRKPVPLGVELRVVGRMERREGRTCTGSGEILLPDDSVAATGSGVYVMLPMERIAGAPVEDESWEVVAHAADPTEIGLP